MGIELSSITNAKRTQVWKQLQEHQQSFSKKRLKKLFKEDEERFDRFSLTFKELLYDFSKNILEEKTLDLLIQLAQSMSLDERVQAMFAGKKINITENRPALHTALRNMGSAPVMVDSKDVMPEIRQVREQMRVISEKLRAGLWEGATGKPITTVVNMGVGGSDLGPRMICEAFRHQASAHIKVLFVSSIDGNEIVNVLRHLDAQTTLFIVSSKSFETADTLANAETAKLWLCDKLGSDKALKQHFIGVSACPEKMSDFGIDPAHQLRLWDWVGGRYSLWSAIGLSIAISQGMHAFEQLLQGAFEADEHFKNSPYRSNVPVLQALIGVWYNNFYGADTQAVLPYDHRLHVLPAYLQQLEMESNGKSATLSGETVSLDTAPIIWGEFGPNAQHAFYQLLHQGTRFVPIEFLAVVANPSVPGKHQELALANCLAQSRALMLGESIAEGADKKDSMIRFYPGNKPSTTILLEQLTPRTLGSLIAFYEHKVFVQSVIWDISPFDQWGVELGKRLTGQLQQARQNGGKLVTPDYDSSTAGLLAFTQSKSDGDV